MMSPTRVAKGEAEEEVVTIQLIQRKEGVGTMG
jgi:hypothetical protein